MSTLFSENFTSWIVRLNDKKSWIILSSPYRKTCRHFEWWSSVEQKYIHTYLHKPHPQGSHTLYIYNPQSKIHYSYPDGFKALRHGGWDSSLLYSLELKSEVRKEKRKANTSIKGSYDRLHVNKKSCVQF